MVIELIVMVTFGVLESQEADSVLFLFWLVATESTRLAKMNRAVQL